MVLIESIRKFKQQFSMYRIELKKSNIDEYSFSGTLEIARTDSKKIFTDGKDYKWLHLFLIYLRLTVFN